MKTYNLKKKILFLSFFLLALLTLLFIFGEIYIRISKEYVTPEIIKNKSLRYSPSLFSRHVFPRRKQNIKNGRFIINSKGYRGHDFSREKPAGTIRIMIYGGSAVFGRYLSNRKDWPHRIEVKLKKMGITNVQVINAGIPGHASFDSLGRLFAEGHIFEPDYVILYNAWNDIKYFSYDDPLLRTFKPYVDSRDPRINYHGSVDKTLCRLSQLYVYLRAGYYNRKYRIDNEGRIEDDKKTNHISDLGPKQFRLNIEMFVDIARNIGAIPILVTQARLVSPNNSDAEKARINYDYQNMNHNNLLKAFDITDMIIKDVSKSKNIEYIDISKEMSGRSKYFKDHVHLTNKGSKKLAFIISQYLIKKLES